MYIWDGFKRSLKWLVEEEMFLSQPLFCGFDGGVTCFTYETAPVDSFCGYEKGALSNQLCVKINMVLHF